MKAKGINVITALIIMALGFVQTIAAEEAREQPVKAEKYQHQGKLYPPVFFKTNVTALPIKEKLESYNAFTKLDEEAVGSPIRVLALNGAQRKQDAAGFSSAMLSITTLGIIPIVSSKVYRVLYVVVVGDEVISSHHYEMTSSEVQNLWTLDNSQKLKPEEEVFLEQSIDKFLTEVAANEELAELFDEYYLYAPEAAQ